MILRRLNLEFFPWRLQRFESNRWRFSVFSVNTPYATQDYEATSGTITFARGATDLTQTISVSILGDTLDESNETFTITLSNPANAYSPC